MLLQNLRLGIVGICVAIPISLVVALGGCSSEAFEGCSRVQVSPDGNWTAYLWEDRRVVQRGPEWYTIQQVVSICCSSSATPEKTKIVKVAEWGRSKMHDPLKAQTHFAFSPQGSRLAVVHPEGLLIVTLASGESHRRHIQQGLVSSLAWIDEDTIGYVTYETLADEGGKTIRTFWRERVNQPADKPVVIHHDTDVRYPVSNQAVLYEADGWPQEFWSPDGKYAVFRGAIDTDAAYLLDLATGNTRKLPGSGALEYATWSHDGRRVLWYAHAGAHNTYNAFLHTIHEWETVDLSGKFQEVFGTPVSYTRIELLWTPDNQFLVGSNLGLGGYLIKPVPWEVRLIGKKLQQPGEAVPPYIRGQAVPGVLIASFAPDEAVVDYNGNILKKLGPGGVSGWTVLPGGEQAVSVGLGNRITVAPVE